MKDLIYVPFIAFVLIGVAALLGANIGGYVLLISGVVLLALAILLWLAEVLR